MIEALRKNENNNLIAIIFGGENDNGIVRNRIIEYQLANQIILAGYCECINDYWQYADLNVLFSINDGFGLSIIEGYMNGVPSIIFADLDAVEDLYYTDAMLIIKNRDIDSIISIINAALNKSWDREKIMRIGSEFIGHFHYPPAHQLFPLVSDPVNYRYIPDNVYIRFL